MFVLDASVACSWLLEETEEPFADQVLLRLEDDEAAVPDLWHLEVRNSLLVALRRGRLGTSDPAERLAALADLPIHTDTGVDLNQAFTLAERHGLSFYDAVYLELAARRAVPLASFDKALVRAAADEGLPTIFDGS